jgi:biotin operon repressor
VSWQAVTWVLEQSEAELGSRLVLLSIASHANREGLSAYPSLDTIGRETLMSRREIIYCIQSLEEKGELHVDRGGGRGNPNHYSLPFVRSWLGKVQSAGKKERVQGLHRLLSTKGATDSVKGAICNNKGCNAPPLNQAESDTSPLQPLENRNNKEPYCGEVPVSSSSLERSKGKTLDEQKAELRARGFLQ